MSVSDLYQGLKDASDHLWLFAECEFDETRLELRVRGATVELELKPLEVLRILLHRSEEVNSKEELLESVWPGLTVVDGSLATAIYKLRKALGDEDSTIVKTVQRVGYRMGVKVRSVPIAPSAAKTPLKLDEGACVPGREQWRLARALDAKDNGTVWLCRNPKTQELRVFKFANTDGRLKSLKREATIFRFLQQSLSGESEQFVHVFEWNFEKPPYYLESEYGGQNLIEWAASQTGLAGEALESRVRIAAEISRAVADAHAAGVIHADLKPSNILILPGQNGEWHVKVCDFGSALLLEPGQLSRMGITNLGYTRTAEAAPSMTGTVPYLAPEVLSGQPPTAASDVYALGVILYQIVAGELRRPLSPGWEAQIDDPLLREDINEAAYGDPALRMKDAATLTERLKRLDERRLERTRLEELRARVSLAAHRRERLRASRPWMITAAATLALAILVVGFALRRTNSSGSPKGAVAILPFRNDSHDSTLGFLSFAVPDEIETQLNFSRSLAIRPFSVTSKYASHDPDLRAIGRDLQVSKVVTGSYLRLGDSLSITVEAFDVVSSRVLWQRTTSVSWNDLRAMQGQLAGLTRTELAPALGATGRTTEVEAHPLNEEAYESYLHSFAFPSSPAAVNKQGLALLEDSVKAFPDYAPAWRELAQREYVDFRYADGGKTAEQLWLSDLNRVLELDPGNVEVTTSLVVHQVETGHNGEAFSMARDLVRRRPDKAAAHFSLGYVFRYAGLLQESAKECDAGFAIDSFGLRSCAVVFIELGNYPRAEDYIHIDQGTEWSNALSLHLLARQGKISEALQIEQPHIAGWESFNLLEGCLRNEPSSEIADLANRVKPSDDPETNYFAATHLAYCGQKQAALQMLQRAISGGYCSYPALDSDPFFGGLRNEPEFQSLREAGMTCQRNFAAQSNAQH
jgi:serine/threonine protein kinase/DNA-binding winged helix-turn-helix (wHTH) protein